MSTPSRAPQPSPQPSRPSSPTPAHNDERNDEIATDEADPLLTSNDSPSTGRFSPAKTINVLMPLALSFSVATLVILIVDGIIMAILPYGNQMPYSSNDALSGVIPIALVTVFINAINLGRVRRSRPLTPLGMNLLLDALIAAFGIVSASNGLGGVVEYYSWRWGQLAVRVLTGVAFGMALVNGIIHLILFAVRCYMAYLLESWRRPWPMPSGQLSFEVSIKFLREPERRRQGGESVV